jgi:hypothetical protein
MRIRIAVIVLLLLAGCAREAAMLDNDYGLAQESVWQQQAVPAEENSPPPEGMEGIDAERIMGAQNSTYGKPPTETNIVTFEVKNK